jgi:hypothetical protein
LFSGTALTLPDGCGLGATFRFSGVGGFAGRLTGTFEG